MMSLSGEQAIKDFKAFKPDVIVMDLLMPGKYNGNQAIQKIRHMDKQTPIILATASRISSAEYNDMDVQGLMIKPTDVNELIKNVSVLSRSKGFSTLAS